MKVKDTILFRAVKFVMNIIGINKGSTNTSHVLVERIATSNPPISLKPLEMSFMGSSETINMVLKYDSDDDEYGLSVYSNGKQLGVESKLYWYLINEGFLCEAINQMDQLNGHFSI